MKESVPTEMMNVERTRWRCRALSLPTLRIDMAGARLPFDRVDGLDSPAIEQILNSEAIQTRLIDAAAEWATQDMPEPVRILEHLIAIPIPETERRRRAGYLIVVAREDDLNHDSAAERDGPGEGPRPIGALVERKAGCVHADNRADESYFAAIERIGAHTMGSVLSLAALLHWTLGDAIEIESKDRALDAFSAQLTESYEEISLLYRQSRLMTELATPMRFVEQSCAELYKTLAFSWVGAAFVSDRQVARDMVGARVAHGVDETGRDAARKMLDYALATASHSCPHVIAARCIVQDVGLKARSDMAISKVVRNNHTIGVIVAGDKIGDDVGVTSADLKLIDAAASSMGIFLENTCLYDDQQAMFLGTLEALTAAIDAKDCYTCGHSERVALLAVRLAQCVGIDTATADRVRISGLVHDIGKIGVPEAVLTKPGRLTNEEFELIKRHPEIGVRILRDIPQLADVLPGVLHHHERWDGNGYPYGLAGQEIPLFGRLLALADAFDAMSSTRTYRSAMGRAVVFDEIRKGTGRQFDPEFAPLFLTLDFTDYDRLVKAHQLRTPRTEVIREAAA